jgi:hypothetical protein
MQSIELKKAVGGTPQKWLIYLERQYKHFDRQLNDFGVDKIHILQE